MAVQAADRGTRIAGIAQSPNCGRVKVNLRGSSGRLALLEAFTAKHRTSLRRLKGHRGFPLATGADGFRFHPLISAAVLRKSQSLGALAFAGLAAFGFVLELFIVEEELFPGSENKISATIDALENLVLELH